MEVMMMEAEVEVEQEPYMTDSELASVLMQEIGQGIGVWFTNLNWGNVDFAILEDRKFKTGPPGRVPNQGARPDHIRNPDYDPDSIDVEGAVLDGGGFRALMEHAVTAARDRSMELSGASIGGKVDEDAE